MTTRIQRVITSDNFAVYSIGAVLVSPAQETLFFQLWWNTTKMYEKIISEFDKSTASIIVAILNRNETLIYSVMVLNGYLYIKVNKQANWDTRLDQLIQVIVLEVTQKPVEFVSFA